MNNDELDYKALNKLIEKMSFTFTYINILIFISIIPIIIGIGILMGGIFTRIK